MWQSLPEIQMLLLWNIERYKEKSQSKPPDPGRPKDHTITRLMTLSTVVLLVRYHNGKSFDIVVRILFEDFSQLYVTITTD